MQTNTPILYGSFCSRLNRFEALVEINGKAELVHVPNTGRLKELLVQGAEVIVKFCGRPGRKTSFSLYLVRKNGIWVSIDSSNIPNAIIAEAFTNNQIDRFGIYTGFKREVKAGISRFDFLLYQPGGECYIEVKGVTLVEEREARFPDAPTERGTRHLHELTGLKKNGKDAGVIFVIQREDADYIKPNDRTDIEFSKALKEARKAGVELVAYRCRVRPESIELMDEIPVLV